MNRFRQSFRDRVTAAAVIAFAVQLLLVQAMAAGFACGTAVAAEVPTGIVICHDGEARVAAGPAHVPANAAGCCLDCQCGTACGWQSGLPAALAPRVDLGPAFASLRATPMPPAPLAPTARPPFVDPDPRGPPSFSA